MRGARPTELRRGPHVSLDFDVPPFRPDPDTVARPMPIWRGADPAMLLRGTAYDGQKLRAVARLDQQGTSVWVMEVHRGYEAMDAWETFDARYPQTGLWPVIATDRTCADVADPIEQRYRLGRVDADPVTDDGRSWLYDEFASLLRREGSNEDLVARQDQDWSPAEFARVEETSGTSTGSTSGRPSGTNTVTGCWFPHPTPGWSRGGWDGSGPATTASAGATTPESCADGSTSGASTWLPSTATPFGCGTCNRSPTATPPLPQPWKPSFTAATPSAPTTRPWTTSPNGSSNPCGASGGTKAPNLARGNLVAEACDPSMGAGGGPPQS